MENKTEKKYKVFEVDTYFGEYGMHYDIIGAESKEDVKAHVVDIYKNTLSKKEIKRLSKDETSIEGFSHINEIPGLWTDEPYKILASYAYIE